MDDYLIEGAEWQDFSISEGEPPCHDEDNTSTYSFFMEDYVVLSFLEELDTKES